MKWSLGGRGAAVHNAPLRATRGGGLPLPRVVTLAVCKVFIMLPTLLLSPVVVSSSLKRYSYVVFTSSLHTFFFISRFVFFALKTVSLSPVLFSR